MSAPWRYQPNSRFAIKKIADGYAVEEIATGKTLVFASTLNQAFNCWRHLSRVH